MSDHKRLSNNIIGLLNKINRKVKSTKLDDYVSKLRIVSNNGHPKDLNVVIDGIVKFAATNIESIKNRKISEIKYENFNVLQIYEENVGKFSDEERADVWSSVDKIIGLAAKIKHAD